MADGSDVLLALRPVTFRYREDFAGESTDRDYGLIAEEVAEVAPELVAYDKEGEPYSVRYHVLPALLLNEVQKQQRTIKGQASVIEEQRAQLGHEAERNEAQEAQLATVLARLDALESQLAGESTGTAQ
jgi:hypothetical protein